VARRPGPRRARPGQWRASLARGAPSGPVARRPGQWRAAPD